MVKENTKATNVRIAKNSAFLFFRTLLIMGVTLYTSRIVLNVLGVIDYGIYNVVGGVVAMLTFLNSAMVQASQRYFNFAQGKGDIVYSNKVFSTSILIHLSIAFIVLILLETIGLWYVNNKIVLPDNRLYAANIIYQFSILIFISKILVVPYTASVIAHERMNVYAYVSIADSLLQLLIVYILVLINFDKLILYGLFLFVISIFNFSIYVCYSKKHFPECHFKRYHDLSLYKEMFAFAGWAFLGGFGYVARSQGVNLVINLFCGPAVNAARGVAYQVSSAIQTFVSSFLHAINPQITKRYANNDINSMMMLVRVGSKYSFLALLICCGPIIMKSNYVLSLWLGQVPEFAPEFLIMAVGMSLVTSMGGSLNTAMQATGNIKLFQIVVAIIMCCDIPLSMILLDYGIAPYLVTGVSILTAFLCLFAKLIILRKLVKYNLLNFVWNVVLKNILIAILSLYLLYTLSKHIPDSFIGLVIICLFSIIITITIICFIGLEKWEKLVVKKYITKLKRKFNKNK